MPVYPLKKGYQIRFEQNGTIFKRNYPSLSKKQAELLEAQIKVKLAMGELHKPGDDVFIVFAKTALKEWARDHWSRPDDADKFLASFEAFFGNKRFNEISPLLIESYKLKLKKGETKRTDATGDKLQRSEKTVNRYLAALSRCFRLAIAKNLIKENPCREVVRYAEGAGRIRYLTDEEFGRLEEALPFQPDYLQALVVLAMNTALRWSNLANLRLEECDFARNEIHIGKTKSGHSLKVPMSEKCRTTLLNWIEKKKIKSGHLFVNPKTGRPYKSVRYSLETLLEDAQIENFTFHCFRHDAISLMVDSGKPLNAVAEIAGHRNIQTTMKYAHAKDDTKRQAVELLGQRVAKPSNNVVQFKKKGNR